MKSKCKIKYIIISALLLVFITVNILWFVNYNKSKVFAKSLDMEKVLFNNKMYYYDTKEYGYRYTLPKYLSFNSIVNVAQNYNFSENEDGTLTNDKKYAALNVITINPLKKYKYEIDFGVVNDDNGIYPGTVYLEHMEINDDLTVKKVYSGTTGRNEKEVEELYHQAFEAVKDLHDATVNFFGDEIFK